MPLKYHWRNLFLRKTTTVVTVLVVAAVVGAFSWMQGFSSALSGSLAVADDGSKLIVINRGATSESSSAIPIPDFNKLAQVNGMARDRGTGDPLLSPETMVQVALPRLSQAGKTTANVAVRGVTETAFKVHRKVKLVEGKLFSAGAREVVVGRKAARQFGGLKIGDTINLGYGSDRGYRVVGYFEAGGGPMESEVWGYLPSLLNAYNRSMYSSANLLLRDAASAPAAIKQIEGPSIELTAQTEPAYWGQQAKPIRIYLGIAYVLAGVMSLAAVISIAITMYSTVAGRTREIAMLRTIGFSRRQILSGVVIEATLLSLMGGVLGCLACAGWLALLGNTKDMFAAQTFTTLAFEIRLTPAIVAASLAGVALVGVLGALPPALRAARAPVIAALREA